MGSAALAGQFSGGCAVHPAPYLSVEKNIVLSLSFLPQITARVRLQPISLPPPAVTQFHRTAQLQNQTSVLNMGGFNSLAIVIYYNSLQCLPKDLSFRHHQKISPSSDWTPFPRLPFGPNLYWLSPHYPRRGYKVLTYFKEQKVLKNPQKHEIKMEVSPFFKHSFKSCKSILKGVLTDGPSEKVKLKWFQKGRCHFLLAISQANCRPAVTLEPRSSSHVIGACKSIFL